MSNLVEHATRELKLSGVDEDIYGDMTSQAVLELVEVFAKQGHSGASAGLVLNLFSKVANFENLTPLTDDPAEWHLVSENEPIGGLWQNSRNSEAFSQDGGETYTLTSETRWVGEGEDRRSVKGPVHLSKQVKQ